MLRREGAERVGEGHLLLVVEIDLREDPHAARFQQFADFPGVLAARQLALALTRISRELRESAAQVSRQLGSS
ncbi:hypothetical protein QT386_07110 [Solimonas sp. SE-A11]|nr:hypothetical protein [Solimonas sp. SE-A11]MDM4769960.1 hypothetical protein [Solimonas sp. SE-A11]